MTPKQMLTVLAAPVAFAAAPAEAATFVYQVTGAYTASFTIDSVQLSPPAESTTDYFVVENIAGTFDGIVKKAESITFNTTGFDGGLTIQLGNEFINLWGSELFSGSTTAPKLLSGSFRLSIDGDTGQLATLQVAAVPEPATWALMVIGFGAAGYTLRRRRLMGTTIAAA